MAFEAYRIVELVQYTPDSIDGTTEIGRYNDPWRALEHMRLAMRARSTVPNWFLVDGCDHILAGPEDLLEAAVETAC
jgi:hypothetical protein